MTNEIMVSEYSIQSFIRSLTNARFCLKYLELLKLSFVLINFLHSPLIRDDDAKSCDDANKGDFSNLNCMTIMKAFSKTD